MPPGEARSQETHKNTSSMASDLFSKVHPKALDLLLIAVTFFFSFSYINYQTPSSSCLFDYSDPVHLLAYLEVYCQSPSYPSLCVVIYNDGTCP